MRFTVKATRNNPWLFILAAFFTSRLLIYTVAYLAYTTITVNYLPNLSSNISSYGQGLWYGILARWDTNWYLFIADKGYTGILWAFFPLYPLTVRGLKILPFDQLFSLTVFSNLLFLGILCLMYLLVIEDWHQEKLAKNVVLATCFFPLAFFFSAPYTESLSVLLILGSYYLSKRGLWLSAFILAMLAGATRVTGVLVAFLLVIEFSKQLRERKVALFKICGFLLIPIGVSVYMFYLKERAGDPLAFLKAQQAWMRSPGIKNLWFIDNPGTYMEKVFSAFYFGIVAYLFYLRRWEYAVYVLMFLAIPLSTGTFMSMPRLGMNAFPIFIAIGAILSSMGSFKSMLLSFSAALLAYYTVLFSLWYWVS